jgi:hypothetical protein
MASGQINSVYVNNVTIPFGGTTAQDASIAYIGLQGATITIGTTGTSNNVIYITFNVYRVNANGLMSTKVLSKEMVFSLNANQEAIIDGTYLANALYIGNYFTQMNAAPNQAATQTPYVIQLESKNIALPDIYFHYGHVNCSKRSNPTTKTFAVKSILGTLYLRGNTTLPNIYWIADTGYQSQLCNTNPKRFVYFNGYGVMDLLEVNFEENNYSELNTGNYLFGVNGERRTIAGQGNREATMPMESYTKLDRYFGLSLYNWVWEAIPTNNAGFSFPYCRPASVGSINDDYNFEAIVSIL